MQSLLNKVLGNYFSVFFKNFREEDFDFNFLRGESCLRNLEVNEQVVQEVLDFPNLEVKRVYVNSLRVKASLTSLRKQPIVISIDRLEVLLCEPVKLSPTPNVLSRLFSSKKSEGHYGLKEKIADGIRIEVEQCNIVVQLLQSCSTSSNVPELSLELSKITLVTTDYRWKVVGLDQARKINKGMKTILAFKALACKAFRVRLINAQRSVTLIPTQPLLLHLTFQKALDNSVLGIQVDVLFKQLKLGQLNFNEVLLLLLFLDAIDDCLERDPQKPENEMSQKSLYVNIDIENLISQFDLSSHYQRSVDSAEKVIRQSKFMLQVSGLSAGVKVAQRNVSSSLKMGHCIIGDISMFVIEGALDDKDNYSVFPIWQLQETSSSHSVGSKFRLETTRSIHPQTIRQPVFDPRRPNPMLVVQFTTRGKPSPPFLDKEAQLLLNPIEITLNPAVLKPFVDCVERWSEVIELEALVRSNLYTVPTILDKRISISFESPQISLVLPLHGTGHDICCSLKQVLIETRPEIEFFLPKGHLVASHVGFPVDQEDMLAGTDAAFGALRQDRESVVFNIHANVDVEVRDPNDTSAVNSTLQSGLQLKVNVLKGEKTSKEDLPVTIETSLLVESIAVTLQSKHFNMITKTMSRMKSLPHWSSDFNFEKPTAVATPKLSIHLYYCFVQNVTCTLKMAEQALSLDSTLNASQLDLVLEDTKQSLTLKLLLQQCSLENSYQGATSAVVEGEHEAESLSVDHTCSVISSTTYQLKDEMVKLRLTQRQQKRHIQVDLSAFQAFVDYQSLQLLKRSFNLSDVEAGTHQESSGTSMPTQILLSVRGSQISFPTYYACQPPMSEDQRELVLLSWGCANLLLDQQTDFVLRRLHLDELSLSISNCQGFEVAKLLSDINLGLSSGAKLDSLQELLSSLEIQTPEVKLSLNDKHLPSFRAVYNQLVRHELLSSVSGESGATVQDKHMELQFSKITSTANFLTSVLQAFKFESSHPSKEGALLLTKDQSFEWNRPCRVVVDRGYLSYYLHTTAEIYETAPCGVLELSSEVIVQSGAFDSSILIKKGSTFIELTAKGSDEQIDWINFLLHAQGCAISIPVDRELHLEQARDKISQLGDALNCIREHQIGLEQDVSQVQDLKMELQNKDLEIMELKRELSTLKERLRGRRELPNQLAKMWQRPQQQQPKQQHQQQLQPFDSLRPNNGVSSKGEQRRLSRSSGSTSTPAILLPPARPSRTQQHLDQQQRQRQHQQSHRNISASHSSSLQSLLSPRAPPPTTASSSNNEAGFDSFLRKFSKSVNDLTSLGD